MIQNDLVPLILRNQSFGETGKRCVDGQTEIVSNT
jgi:hypothetical protein